MAGSLNILLLIETGGAGSGRHVIDLAGELAGRGHRLGIVYSDLRIESWFRAELDALEGVRQYRVAMRRAPHPSDLAAVAAVRRILRNDGPFDIVHGHSSKGGAIARLATIGLPVSCVYTPHAFFTMSAALPVSKRLLYGSVERLLAPLTDRIICVSSAERDHAQSLGIAPARLTVVPNGLGPLPEADRASVRAELGLTPGDVAIGFVGRLAEQKAVQRLVRAFAAVEDPSARLVVVGGGPDEDGLKTLASELGVASRCAFTGPADGARMMAGFDVFALPSLYEAFPYVLIEAAFRGLPIVSMDVGGTAELVHDEVNGFVVEQGNETAFAAALRQLVDDAALRHRLGRGSVELGESFSVAAMTDRTLTVYEDLAGAR